MNSTSLIEDNRWLAVVLGLSALLAGGRARAQYAGSQACIECHGAIYNTASKTRHFQVNVGCESCHGPSAQHAADYSDPTVLPVVDTLGTVCGNCHDGAQHPYYSQWSASAHKAAAVGCPTCHDPHAVHTWTNVLSGLRYTNQLRTVIASTNNYFHATSTVSAANINLCAQCHNHHGASWTNSAAPPVMPQYNLMLGTIGELSTGSAHYQPAAHALRISEQCVGCHMATAPYQSPSQPANTGHKFKVELFSTCVNCHPYPQQLVQFVTDAVTNRILTIKYELDQWALTKAPATLRAKYGRRAWEYTAPGELSSGGGGPTAAEQAQVPVNIRKARFNLYLVQHDGSAGVHNGPFFITLLDAAQNWVEAELSQ
jgi:formate-dependent nitrite reductase cytochrome c552 subunit